MSDSQSTTIIDNAASGPSLEEQYEALKAEGVISDDGEVPVDGGSVDEAQGETADDQGDAEERPSWLPERFANVEEYVAYVNDLETSLSTDDEEGEGDDPQYAEATEEERKAAEEATARAGLDLNTVSQEWFENEGLTEDTYTKLEKAGYPREMVDIYIEGLTSRATVVEKQAYDLVGGQDQYGEMIQWAIQNLDPKEQAAFDASVNSNDPAKAMLAIKGLKASWRASVEAESSQEPETHVTSGGKAAVSVYESLDDYMEDLNDPRYDKNESFRTKVAAKLARSRIM
jgi:hypothetical protein